MPGRCGAKLRYTDPPRYCKKYPVKGGNGRCERCGGKSPPPGIMHPRYKSGKFSKYLPRPVAERVAESFNSAELLSIRTEAAVADARFTMLMERLHTGESGSLWKMLTEAWSDLEGAHRTIRESREAMQRIPVDAPDAEQQARRLQDKINGAQQAAADAMGSIGRLIQSGHKDELAWRELINMSHEVASLKQAEFKRLSDMRQMMTAEEVLAIYFALQRAIVEVVTDPKQRAAIGIEFQKIMPTKALGNAVTTIEGEAG